MKHRNFQLDTEWSMIQYPEKPTGFGVLIIGDERHFVDANKSFWMQNEGKQILVNELLEAGYTVFSSNLYGRHWGSEKAVDMAKRLYHHILKNEILNEKIHILAEGMGALVALKLLETMSDKIRSAVLLNPILSLKLHLEQEKEHKFFYKKLMRELVLAYGEESSVIEQKLIAMQVDPNLDYEVPIRIIHILAGGRAFIQSKNTQKLVSIHKSENNLISAAFMLPEKKQQLGPQLIKFFNSKEKIL